MRRRTFRHGLRAWSRRQLYSFFSSLGTLLSHRVGTAMTVLVLGIAMALPLGLYLALQNLRAVDLRQEQWGAITVFLDAGVSEAETAELTARIDGRDDADANAVSPAAGLAEFREASGFGEALDVLEQNPLPWVIEVRPRAPDGEVLAATVSALSDWLQSLDPVDAVIVDYKWLQRLAGLIALGDAVVTVLVLLFSVAVLVVIANTIRLDVANRADEIEVLSLVGAGDGFIRQPFLYSGFWYGLLGAALALALLHGSLVYLQRPLEGLLDAYGNTYSLRGLGLGQCLAVLLGGGLLGLTGSWISVARYLRALRRGGLAGRL